MRPERHRPEPEQRTSGRNSDKIPAEMVVNPGMEAAGPDGTNKQRMSDYDEDGDGRIFATGTDRRRVG